MDLESARNASLGDGGKALDEEKPGRSGALNQVFRFRYALHLLVYAGGFGISWANGQSSRSQRIWLVLPETISRWTGMDLNRAIIGVTGSAIVLAIAAALLRTCGTAYLGTGIVADPELQGAEIAVSGPYRYVRNPLYIGTVLHSLALCLLMSWAGAMFTIVAILLLQAALIAAEERYLARERRGSYEAYRKRVRRFLPHILHPTASAGGRPEWGRAVLGEVYMWGAAISFAAFGAGYNALPILQGLLVSFGISIVVRALMNKR